MGGISFLCISPIVNEILLEYLAISDEEVLQELRKVLRNNEIAAVTIWECKFADYFKIDHKFAVLIKLKCRNAQ
jgi:hypothetical protein